MLLDDPEVRTGKAAGVIQLSSIDNPIDFVEHCRQVGVRSVTEVSFDTDGPCLLSLLQKSEINYRHLHFPYAGTPPGHNVVERRMFEVMRKLCAKGRKALPELLFFGDDYAARGALMACLAEGVDIPHDMKLVSWVAKGNEPVFTKELTRFETDCWETGRACARNGKNRRMLNSNNHGVMNF